MSHVCKDPWRPGVFDDLELELQAVMSCLTWVLGRAISTLTTESSLKPLIKCS